MSAVFGSFAGNFVVAPGFAGFKTVTSSFGLTVNVSFGFEAFINRLVLTVDTPASLTFTPDTTAPL